MTPHIDEIIDSGPVIRCYVTGATNTHQATTTATNAIDSLAPPADVITHSNHHEVIYNKTDLAYYAKDNL